MDIEKNRFQFSMLVEIILEFLSFCPHHQHPQPIMLLFLCPLYNWKATLIVIQYYAMPHTYIHFIHLNLEGVVYPKENTNSREWKKLRIDWDKLVSWYLKTHDDGCKTTIESNVVNVSLLRLRYQHRNIFWSQLCSCIAR